MNTKIVWYARGGGIEKCGPFKTQIEAVNAMRMAGRPDEYPADAFVWPEVVKESLTRSIR